VHLLVVVVEDEEDLDEVVTVLVEHELLDSVVLEARTGLELLERDLPIFAGLRALVPGGIDFCRLILCPVPAERGGEVLDDLHGIHQGEATPSGFALLLEPGRLIRL
jgi:hypothetical protein